MEETSKNLYILYCARTLCFIVFHSFTCLPEVLATKNNDTCIKSGELLKSLSVSRRCSRGGLEIWDMRLLEEEEYDCVIKGEKKKSSDWFVRLQQTRGCYRPIVYQVWKANTWSEIRRLQVFLLHVRYRPII